jgi:uncharacterized protein
MIFTLLISGCLVGVLSGFLGVGGGLIIVPFLVFLGNLPLDAVGTSVLTVLIITMSASFHNWRQGNLEQKKLIYMSFPCIISTQIGVISASNLPDFYLLFFFGIFLIACIILFKLHKKKLHSEASSLVKKQTYFLLWVGGLGGFLSGIFGVGGGAVLVPLQVLILKYPLKSAVRTSLGVVMISAFFSSIGHCFAGNINFNQALLLGVGGLTGAQMGARLLPKLKDETITRYFVLLLSALAIYVFWKAYSIADI